MKTFLSALVALTAWFTFNAFAAPLSEDLKQKEEAQRVEWEVRLKLLDLDVQQHTENYRRDLRVLTTMKDQVEQFFGGGNAATERAEKAISKAAERIKSTKSVLIELEKERAMLLAKLKGRQAATPADPSEKLQKTLEQVLDRLTRIEKRLESMETSPTRPAGRRDGR